MESLDARPLSKVAHELPDAVAAHALDDHLPCDGQVGDKEQRFRRGGGSTIDPEVVAHERGGRRREGHRGVLTALTAYPSESESWVQVSAVERDDLAPAKPSVRQEREDRAAASSPAYAQQRLNRVPPGRTRQLRSPGRAHQQLHGVRQKLAAPDRPPREAGEAGQPDPDRRRAQPSLSEVVLVGADELGGEAGDGERRSWVALGEAEEVGEAGAVRTDRYRTTAALDGQVGGEHLEQRREMRNPTTRS